MEKKIFTSNMVKHYGKELSIEQREVNPLTLRNFTCQMNIENTQEYMEQTGLFVAVSNTNLSAQEMIECIW